MVRNGFDQEEGRALAGPGASLEWLQRNPVIHPAVRCRAMGTGDGDRCRSARPEG